MSNWNCATDCVLLVGPFIKVLNVMFVYVLLFCNYFISNRVLAIIILLTPTLGLFNTLHHGRMAAIPVRNDLNREPFDHTVDNGIITFQEAWEQFRLHDPSEFVYIPPYAVLAIMLVMFLFHILASSCILKVKLKSKSLFILVQEGLYTLISPPLHYDWEFFYRQSDEQDSTVKVCWKK